MTPDLSENSDFFASRDAISRFLFVSDEPQAVDICVVLGAPSFTNVDPAISLFHAGFVKTLLITGYGPAVSKGAEGHVPEYEGLMQRALDAGIPRECILLEKAATNTLENFQNASDLIEAEFTWDRIGAVAIAGKPLHMRRALMTARKHWPEHIRLVMLPSTSETDLQRTTWFRSEPGRKRVLNELRSVAEYALKGDLGGI